MLSAEQLEKVVALRRALHDCPERSGQEARTMATIRAFLAENTTLELQDMGGWLLATHREGDGLPAVASGRTWTRFRWRDAPARPVTAAATTATAPYSAASRCCWRAGASERTST